MKKDCTRTTVYIPNNLLVESKKRGHNLSKMFAEYLEMEIYQESPEFLKKKINELEGRHEREKDILLAQLKVAEERHHLKKERMDTSIPKVMDYRTIIPKKKEGK